MTGGIVILVLLLKILLEIADFIFHYYKCFLAV
jgi:hypothetical protein